MSITWEERIHPNGTVEVAMPRFPPDKKTKRFRGFTLTEQGQSFDYWWYGDNHINITLTCNPVRSHMWRLVVEFHYADLEIVVERPTENKVRREFSRRLHALKPLIDAMVK